MTQRRRFQLSLRTAIVLMLLAGALIGANIAQREGSLIELPARMAGDEFIPRMVVSMKERGWPIVYDEWYLDEHHPSRRENWAGLVINFWFALFVLSVVWFLMERGWREIDTLDC